MEKAKSITKTPWLVGQIEYPGLLLIKRPN